MITHLEPSVETSLARLADAQRSVVADLRRERDALAEECEQLRRGLDHANRQVAGLEMRLNAKPTFWGRIFSRPT